jgi:hypothetical protein
MVDKKKFKAYCDKSFNGGKYRKGVLQMKKNCFCGMFATVLALGLVLVGCPTTGSTEPYTGPKTIKITGYNSKVVTSFREIEIWSLDQGIQGIDNWESQFPVAAQKELKIDGQTITCEMLDSADWSEYWTGTGKFYIQFQCYPPKDSSYNVSHYVYSEDGKNPTPVDIKGAVTTLEWSKFIWFKDSGAG